MGLHRSLCNRGGRMFNRFRRPDKVWRLAFVGCRTLAHGPGVLRQPGTQLVVRYVLRRRNGGPRQPGVLFCAIGPAANYVVGRARYYCWLLRSTTTKAVATRRF